MNRDGRYDEFVQRRVLGDTLHVVCMIKQRDSLPLLAFFVTDNPRNKKPRILHRRHVDQQLTCKLHRVRNWSRNARRRSLRYGSRFRG